MSLVFLAPLAARSGYGTLARGMASAMAAIVPETAAVDLSDFPGGRLKLPAALTKLLDRPQQDGSPWLRLDVPWRGTYLRSATAPSLIYTMFEAFPLPESWVRALGTLDGTVVPSDFCAEIFVSAGCRNVSVCPPGVDSRFTPEAPPLKLDTRSVTFLFVGEYTHRKGLDVALGAYTRAFSSIDDVSLVVKTWSSRYTPDQIEQSSREQMARISRAPPHTVFVHSILPDALLPSLYTAATALLLPSRSEAYGLPAAEAQACGVPVIATGATGLTEVARASFAYQVRSLGLIPSRDHGLQWDFYGGRLMHEPDEDHLVDIMRHVCDHPEEARKKGSTACGEMHRRTWRQAGMELIDLLKTSGATLEGEPA